MIGAEPLLRVRALRLAVGARTLVHSLALDVEPGQFWVVLGPNGAGKTSLLATLAGLLEPVAGTIELLGRALDDWRPVEAARVRALLPQHIEPQFGVSALAAALLGRHPHQGRGLWPMWEADADVRIALDALARLDVLDLAARDMASLSGGERQRVALAGLVAQEPRLALLDEPLSHLDLHHQHDVMRLLRARADADGGAIVASVHDLSMAARFATHALVFAGGGRCLAGPARETLSEVSLSAAFGHRVRRLVEGELVAWIAG